MVQTSDVVCCASCSTFQQQLQGATKKRWTCTMCGEKQSYVRVYASGAAKDMRPIVQQLNMARGAAAEEATATNCVMLTDQEQDGAWQMQMGCTSQQPSSWHAAERWGGSAPWNQDANASWYHGTGGAWPIAPPAPTDWGAPALPPHAAESSGDMYFTSLPSRPSKPAKRKYGPGSDQFQNDPRRQLQQHQYGQRQPTWQEAQAAAFGHSRPPPRSFHAARPTASTDDVFVTSGAVEVLEEEVWQG